MVLIGADAWIGCGRFFEGDAAQMHKALNETLASLPDDTKVYVCHYSMFCTCVLEKIGANDASV